MRPSTLLLSIWLVAVALTAYCGPEMAQFVAEDEELEDSFLVTVADHAVSFGEETGVLAMRDQLERVREYIYDPPGDPGAIPPPRRSPAAIAAARGHAGPGGGGGGGGGKVATTRDTPVEKVLLIGASSMQLALGKALEAELEDKGLDVKRKAKSATGLTQPELYDWMAKTEELLSGYDADVVIVNFGGNDAMALKLARHKYAKFGTEAWDQAYGDRVTQLVELIHAHGAQAIIIGMPVMRSKKFSKKMKKLNQVTQDATEAAGGIYMDQWDLSATSDGEYREEVKVDGRTRLMRDDDGIHYSRWGGIYVARGLVERMLGYLGLDASARAPAAPAEEATAAIAPGAAPEVVAAAPTDDNRKGMFEKRRFASAALGRKVLYLVWRPEPREGETYPVLLLLHGAGASAYAYSDGVGDELTALAARHKIVIVAPDGGTNWWLDSPIDPKVRYETMVAEELIAELERELPVSKVRGAMGYSMGGHGALNLAMRRPGLLVSASSTSGVVDLTEAGSRAALKNRLGKLDDNRAVWEAHSVLHLIRKDPAQAKEIAMRFTCGTRDRWIGANRRLHEELDQLGVAHDYDEHDGGHDWSAWRKDVPSHVEWHAERLRAQADR